MNYSIPIDTEFLRDFCHKWQIQELSFFGSVLRDDFGPGSDVDILVSFFPDSALDILDIVDMKQELESHFNRAVDIVEKESLRNPWRKNEILKTREVIYAA